MNNAAMYDYELYRTAGMIPPAKAVPNITPCLYGPEDYRRLIAIKDRQDAISRYKWFNLPKGLTGELIERILYLRGQGMLFKWGKNFYFLPYTLDTNGNEGIDCYGRYKGCTPVTMGSTKGIDGKYSSKDIVNGKHYDVIYDINLDDNIDELATAVLLFDYTPDVSQHITARKNLQQPVIAQESEMFPFMQTALISKTGVRGMRVNDADSATQVTNANNNIKGSALSGKTMIPLISAIEMQDLSGDSNTGDPAVFTSAVQSLENFRKGCLGISTDGLLQKNQHVLDKEQQMNATSNQSQIDDGLLQRQKFCVLAESIWHLGIWCEVNESKQTQAVGDNPEQEQNSGGGEDDTQSNEQ